MQAIQKALKKLTAKKSALYQAEYEACLAAEKLAVKEMQEAIEHNPMSAHTQSNAYFNDGKLIPNADFIMKNRVEITVDNLMKDFMEKQLSKINLVIKQRPIRAVEILDNKDDVKELQYIVIMANGDYFEIRNQIVVSYGKNLKPITRFPTTFHNIKKGKESFKKKAQEWMEEFF